MIPLFSPIRKVNAAVLRFWFAASALISVFTTHSMSFAATSATQFKQKVSATQQSGILSELRQLQQLSTKNDAIEASFEQKTYSALRKKLSTSSGTLQFSHPRMFRWEVTSPRSELYVNNDKWFWKYIESTKHALRMPASSSELEFLDVIFNFEALPKKFNVSKARKISHSEFKTELECSGRISCFELTPQAQERHRQITIAIDTQTGYAKLVYIEFRNGNKTEISFSQYKQSELSKRDFEFSPPPGTAIDKR
ncbi:MAG: outer rane lipoprotein chaperone LolA [Pseudomonadota bacterium]|jgi:outer membrane lipoprotein-sorting protein